MSASRSGAIFTYTYPTALAAGTYTVQVMLRGAQNTAFTGNGTMPLLVVLTSTNTAFTFEFIDAATGNALTPTPTSLNIDFVTMQQSL